MGSKEQASAENRKKSGRQLLQVDGSRRQIGLDLHVGEAAADGARKPMPRSWLRHENPLIASDDVGRAAGPLRSIFRDGDEPAAEPDSHG